MTIKDIEFKLEELEERESQILFSASKLNKEDYEMLRKIKEERKILNEKLAELKEDEEQIEGQTNIYDYQ